MRTPPRLSVASDRPASGTEPRRGDRDPVALPPHAGKRSKYVDSIALPSGRSTGSIGIDGIGAVSTNSPTSPTTRCPSGIEGVGADAQPPARALARLHRQELAAAEERGADVGPAADRVDAHLGPSCSLSHRQPLGGSGEPVGITVRSPPSVSSSELDPGASGTRSRRPSPCPARSPRSAAAIAQRPPGSRCAGPVVEDDRRAVQQTPTR